MTPSGRAPVMETLRVASATLIAAPRYGSSAATPWTQSVEATRPSGVPFTRRTAAPAPGPATVFVCDGAVVLLGDPAPVGDVRRAEQAEQHEARIHPPLRQVVAGLGGLARGRSRATARGRLGGARVDDRVARECSGRDACELGAVAAARHDRDVTVVGDRAR